MKLSYKMSRIWVRARIGGSYQLRKWTNFRRRRHQIFVISAKQEKYILKSDNFFINYLPSIENIDRYNRNIFK